MGPFPTRDEVEQGAWAGERRPVSYRRKLSHEKLRRWLRRFSHLNINRRTAWSKCHKARADDLASLATR